MLVSEDHFIPANHDIQQKDDPYIYLTTIERQHLVDRWDTPTGQDILHQWSASGYDRAVLDRLVGKLYGQTDIRGIDLHGRSLSGLNLRDVDLFASNLSGADLKRADLTHAHLSESNIRGAKFDWANMEGVLLDNVDYDAATSFLGVDLNKVNFVLAALVQEHALTQNRIANLRKKNPILAFFLRVTSDYGRNFTWFLCWCLAIIIFFGYLSYVIPNAISTGTGAATFGDGLYFSFVTFTTLGFGAVTPGNMAGKIIFVAEVTIGYMMLSLLVAILSKRVFGP